MSSTVTPRSRALSAGLGGGRSHLEHRRVSVLHDLLLTCLRFKVTCSCSLLPFVHSHISEDSLPIPCFGWRGTNVPELKVMADGLLDHFLWITMESN